MNYYTVLSETSALLLQQNFTMRRCRRRFNGPHRYVLADMHGHTVHFDETATNRRMGYTLHELLEWLSTAANASVAAEARALLHDLEASLQIRTAS